MSPESHSADGGTPPTRAEGEFASFGLTDAWAMLVLQRRLMASIVAVVLLGVIVFTLVTTPTYRARATIHLTVPTAREITDNSSNLNYIWNERAGVASFYPTQLEIMESSTLRREVLERFEVLHGSPDDVLTTVGQLHDATTIKIRELTELVDISVDHPDPERAAQLANLYAEVYQDYNLDAGRDAARDARTWLDTQIGAYEERIDELGDKLVVYQEDNDLADAEQEVSALDARVQAVKTALANTRTQLVELQGRVAAHEQMLRDGDLQRLAQRLDTTLLIALTDRYATALTSLVETSARYGPRHPQRIAAEAAVERIQEELRDEARRAVDAERAELSVLARNADDLEAEARTLDEALLGKQRVREGYERLKTELERSKEYKVRLAQRMDELDLMARTQLNNARLIQRAKPPSVPYRPNLLFNLAMGTPLAFVLALGAGLIRHQMDETITSPLDITVHLGTSYLGTIPNLPEEGLSPTQAALYTRDNPRSLVAEAMRALRTVLDRNSPNGRARRLMITSAMIGEGKTDTTVRLALAFARAGRQVAIVDGDLRRPRQHKAFGIATKEPGLTDALLGGEVLDFMRDTGVDGVHLLTAGTGDTSVTELLGSERMDAVLSRLETVYDVVLVDTPPILLTADPGIVSHLVEGVVVVVRSRKVARGAVRHAISALQKVGAPILGVILNGSDTASSIGGYYGGRYGYYRYDNAYEDPDTSSAAK